MIPESHGPLRLRAALVGCVVFLASVQALAIALSLCAVPIARWGALGILAASVLFAWRAAESSRAQAATGAAAAHAARPATTPASDLAPAREEAPGAESLWTPLTRRAVTIAALVILGAFVALACLTRDGSFDGNAYHIPAINQWAVHGRIGEVSAGFAGSELMNGFPKGAEAVTFVFVEAFGGKLLGLLNVFYAPLGLLGIALLCGLFGAGAADALLFGLCYLLTPASMLQFGTTYVDSAFASSVIAMLALMAWRLEMPRGNRLADALAIGCAIGNVIAAKTSGVVIVAIAIAAFLLFGLARRNPSGEREPPGALIGSLGAACAVAVLVGGYWYIRNFVLHGNPLYPLSVSIGGHTLWPGTPESQLLFERANTPPGLLALRPLGRVMASWVSLYQNADYSADRRLGSLGVMWSLGCLPATFALAIGVLKRRLGGVPALSALGFLAVSVALGFLAMPMNWWGRYTMWVFALGLPCAWGVFWVVRASSGRRLVIEIWLLGCVGLLLAQDAIILAKDAKWTIAAARIEARTPHVFPLFPQMNGHLARRVFAIQAAIGIGPGELGRDVLVYGQLAQAWGIGTHDLVPIAAEPSAAEMQALGADARVRYVLWLASSPLPAALAPHAVVRGAEGPFTYWELVR